MSSLELERHILKELRRWNRWASLRDRFRRLRRFECWWRNAHRVAWRGSTWECQRCLTKIRAAPPAGALLTDEPMRHIYQTQADGSIRRLDKVKGGKKARRRKVEEVARVERLRSRLLGDTNRQETTR